MRGLLGADVLLTRRGTFLRIGQVEIAAGIVLAGPMGRLFSVLG